MKYKVGDKVKVRDDLSPHIGASIEMCNLYTGKVVTIAYVNEDMEFYHIKEDPGKYPYVWDDIMFE
jgi:hypothetical protein